MGGVSGIKEEEKYWEKLTYFRWSMEHLESRSLGEEEGKALWRLDTILLAKGTQIIGPADANTEYRAYYKLIFLPLNLKTKYFIFYLLWILNRPKH